MNVTQIPAKYFTTTRLFQKVDTIVIHWIDGTLEVADKVFTGQTNRQVSSHFAVENEEVHQYVKLGDTAWQAGNWLVNLRSVGIEHSAEPGRDANDQTYETSSQLIVQICKQLGLTPSRGLLKRHSDIVPTQCPGTIDIDRIANRAVELWNPPIIVTPAVAQTQGIHFDPFLTDLEPSQEYSDEVKRMQRFLELKGNFRDQGNQDGYYGPITQRAVHDFQGVNGITGATRYGWWHELTREQANQQLSISNTQQS